MRLLPLAALLILPLLAACQARMETHIRLSDIVEAGDNAIMLAAPATLRVPQQDYAHCVEALDGIVTNLGRIMPVRDPRCTDVDASTTFADFETDIALVPQNAPDRKLPGILMLDIVASDEGDAQHYAVTLVVMRTLDELARLAIGTKQPLGDPLPYELIPRITIAIENDLTQDALIEYSDLFVDGRPTRATDKADEVWAGQTRQLQLSDLASSLIAGGRSYPIATIWPVQR